MNDKQPTPISYFVSQTRPLLLVLGILMFALGTGIVHYLGTPINWFTFLVGQGCITVLQLSSSYLKAYYDRIEKDNPFRKPKQFRTQDDLITIQLLQISLIGLTTVCALTVILFFSGIMNLTTLIILGFAFFLAYFYAVPPLRFSETGYGELAYAFLNANLIPAFAYLVQTGELHRLLGMLTFPLTALYLSTNMALSLPNFASDLKNRRQTLLTRLNWQRGMNLHNILILTAYLIIGIAALLGLPWSLTWPVLLTLPIGIYQIYQMIQISQGAKPNWKILKITALACLGLTAYFLTLSLWIG